MLQEEAELEVFAFLVFSLGFLGEGEDVGGWDMVVPARLDALGLSQLRLWCAKCPGMGVNRGI